MKKLLFIILLGALFAHSFVPQSKAQSTDLILGNILNGALTGSALGLATMGLNNDSNFAPFRIGLGAGILGGTAIFIYDVSTLPQGQQFFISGLFNDGQNSSILLLLDTAYGAAVGTAVGTAVIIISNKSLLKGIQYGASAGAWVGFGVGLVDTFFIAERNRDFTSSLLNSNSIFSFDVNNSSKIDLFSPDLFTTFNTSNQSLSLQVEPVLNVVSYRKTF